LLAAWVTQPAVGCALMPRTRTRRDHGENVLALPGEGDRLDEVDGQQCLGLTAEEVGPGAGRSVGCGIDALGLEDLPHRRGCDLDCEGGEFAVDTPVSPGRVFADQAQDQSANGAHRRWTSGPFPFRDVRVLLFHQVAVPAQDRVRSHEQLQPA